MTQADIDYGKDDSSSVADRARNLLKKGYTVMAVARAVVGTNGSHISKQRVINIRNSMRRKGIQV